MSALEFLVRGRRDVTVAYFNHMTEHGHAAQRFLEEFCATQKLPLVVSRYNNKYHKTKPTEETWRNARYDFFDSLNKTVVTGHHLSDAVEWWIFSAFRGKPALIPTKRDDIPVIKPFVMTDPNDLHRHFCEYPHIEDPTNSTIDYTRNYIRHELVPRAKRVNPGLNTTIRNLYKKGL